MRISKYNLRVVLGIQKNSVSFIFEFVVRDVVQHLHLGALLALAELLVGRRPHTPGLGRVYLRHLLGSLVIDHNCSSVLALVDVHILVPVQVDEDVDLVVFVSPSILEEHLTRYFLRQLAANW